MKLKTVDNCSLRNHQGRYMMAIDAIFQVNVDLLALGIRYLWNDGFPATIALQADSCKNTRKVRKEVWPDCTLSSMTLPSCVSKPK